MSSHQPKNGGLKQVNKSHKVKHRSKGAIAAESAGRVASFKSTVASKADHRQQRRNTASQIRKAHRLERTLERTKTSAPFLIVVVDLCHADGRGAEHVAAQLLCCGEAPARSGPLTTVHVARLKRTLSVAVAPRATIQALELAKAADLLLFVVSAADAIDDAGRTLTSCLYMQGVPTVAHVVIGLDQLPAKRRADAKKLIVHDAEAAFPETRVHTVDKPGDIAALLWALLNQKHRPVRWLGVRAHVLAEAVQFEAGPDGTGTLHVTGFIRARPLSANRLVYLPGYGAFQVSQIRKATPPGAPAVEVDMAAAVLAEPDAALQEPLQMEIPIDPLAGEQTWPTEDELHHADLEERLRRARAHEQRKEDFVRAPKGTSSYQAAWIEDTAGADHDGDDGDDDGEESGSEDDAMDGAAEHGSWDGQSEHSASSGGEEDEEMELVPSKEAPPEFDRARQYDEQAMAEGCVSCTSLLAR